MRGAVGVVADERELGEEDNGLEDLGLEVFAMLEDAGMVESDVAVGLVLVRRRLEDALELPGVGGHDATLAHAAETGCGSERRAALWGYERVHDAESSVAGVATWPIQLFDSCRRGCWRMHVVVRGEVHEGIETRAPAPAAAVALYDYFTS